MAIERKGIIEKTTELSKNIDKVLILGGLGVYILINKAAGAAIIIGSVITIIPAEMIERWIKNRKRKKAAKR